MIAAAARRAAGPACRFGLLLCAAVFIAACTGGPEGASPTPAVTVIGTPASFSTINPPAGDPGVTVENAVQACREKNAGLLSSLLAEPVAADDIDAMFGQGNDVLLKQRDPAEVIDGEATVETVLEVQRDGETELVDRTWELVVDDDGVWRLAGLPECF